MKRPLVFLVFALMATGPINTLGQQSILLSPTEQAPLMPMALPENAKAVDATSDKPYALPQGTASTPKQIILQSIKPSQTTQGAALELGANGALAQYTTQELQNPSRLVIDLLGVQASPQLKNSISFVLGNIRLGKYADKTRIVVDFLTTTVPAYKVLQNNNKLVINFEKNQTSPLPLSAANEAVETPVLRPIFKQDISKSSSGLPNKLMSVDFRDADIRNVLRFMADAVGVNIVAGDNISGRVTIQLKNVPWADALKAILQVMSLAYDQADGIIRILPPEDMQKEQNSRLINSQLAENNMPLTRRLIPVNYTLANSFLDQIKSMLTLRGQVSVDERTNVLIVSDIQSSIDNIDRLIQSLDTQTPQVLIEARLVEATTQFSRKLGVQWGGSIFGVNGGTVNPTGIAGNAAAMSPNYAVNLPVANPTSSIGFSLGNIGNMAVLNARISAAEVDGQAKTVSMPKIMTLDNKAARITQGFQIPYTISNLNATETQFVQAALELNVVPHVTADGSVQMSLKITHNSPDFSKLTQIGVPAIAIKEAITELLVKDGDTVVIGGIYTRSLLNKNRSVPFLSKIPVLGWLFKDSDQQDEQSEMLVFLTPRLMNRQKATVNSSLVEIQN